MVNEKNPYKVLKFDDTSVYLVQNGKIKKLSRELFDFDIKLGDEVDYMKDGDIVLVFPSQFAQDKTHRDAVKSNLLQGILNLFLETLSIHNDNLGHLKSILSQLLVTFFMAWSLLGVIAIELLLLIESILTFVWRLLIKGLKRLHLVDNSRKYLAYRKQQKQERLVTPSVLEKSEMSTSELNSDIMEVNKANTLQKAIIDKNE